MELQQTVEAHVAMQRPLLTLLGRVLHSSTFELNLSRLRHKTYSG